MSEVKEYRNIPTEYARSGREHLIATVANEGTTVWCNTASGSLVAMNPQVKNRPPVNAMEHGPSERSERVNNCLRPDEIPAYFDEMLDLPGVYDEVAYKIASFSDLYRDNPERQFEVMQKCGKSIGWTPMATRWASEELQHYPKKAIHNLMTMEPKSLGCMIAGGLPTRDVDAASKYSVNFHDVALLEKHLEQHIGYALEARLNAENQPTKSILCCGSEPINTDDDPSFHILTLDDYSQDVQERALKHIGLELSTYQGMVQSLEACGLAKGTRQYNENIYRLVYDKYHGKTVEIEAVEMPEFSWGEGTTNCVACSLEETNYEEELRACRTRMEQPKEHSHVNDR